MKPFFTTLLVTVITFTAYTQANTSLSNLATPTSINQHLLPNSSTTKDLGSSANSWRNLFMSGHLFVDGSRFLHNGGTDNTFVGKLAGNVVSTGAFNTGLGSQSLYSLTKANYNTAVGYKALYKDTTGNNNTALGAYTLYNNLSGNKNTATGYYALYSNTRRSENTATGYGALISNTTGIGNTAIGYAALYTNSQGVLNTATGYKALYSNTWGLGNSAFGMSALHNNTSGEHNTAVGDDALHFNVSGAGNTALGTYADVTAGNLYNATALGYRAVVDVSNKVRVGSTSVTSIGGQVSWTAFSDGRYKKNIREDVQGLEFINSLKPITYTADVQGLNAYYNKGRKQPEELQRDEKAVAALKEGEERASKIIYNGFIAQEVEEAAKKLNYEFSGVDKPQSKGGLYGLRYSDFVVPLVVKI